MFTVQEHVIPCQFMREYPRATADGRSTGLSLAVKQYTPTRSPDPTLQRVTIIGAAGNACPKELYEPLWEELHSALLDQRLAIENIWIADAAHQGASGLLNEEKLGNDPSIFDHSRDLIHMINHFQSQMTLPIIGLGHSMGATHLMHAALSHSRLFHAQILIEPVLYDTVPDPATNVPALGAAARRDRWPSHDALASYVANSKLYASWDARCVQRWLTYGVRRAARRGELTLVTTKDQETFALTRPTYLTRTPQAPSTATVAAAAAAAAAAAPRLSTAELDRKLVEHPEWSFLQPEPLVVFHQLPFFRPAALYVYGALSWFLKGRGLRARMAATTGAGVLGSGGVARGRVQEMTIEQTGHNAPLERPGAIARETAGWIADEVRRWQAEEQAVEEEWQGKTGVERRMLDEEFVSRLGVRERRRKL
ncbi:Alpha/beta hydrolase family-domain-containing protein [Aspergillus ambiguus]|uniref:alpha/beta hydrolase n=1 Tax=Aspergillus ambiguus TaxID=176160 RepID=UPI003CCE1E23